MKPLCDNVFWCGAIDWDRRMFDALIPLPQGTSYNAYLVRGTEKTVLLDTVDESMADRLLDELAAIPARDYIVCQHAEQDHSGALPQILARYPQAQVLAGPPGRNALIDLLHLPPERITAVKEGETLPLGGRTLRFIWTPWVHWPDTICTFLEEERVLFSCDFFGSHLATSQLYAGRDPVVYDAAKLYYAEIMMPYAKQAAKNIEKVAPLNPALIAPSHGPVYDEPAFIMDAWREWTTGSPKNRAVIAYVSMHGSTRQMADRLTAALMAGGVAVERFDLTVTDLGRLATALVDAATLLLGTPATLNGPHPLAVQAAHLVNLLKPKLKHIGFFGSYGWGPKALDGLPRFFDELAVEYLPPVICRGAPRTADFQSLEQLAAAVAGKHGMQEGHNQ